MTDATAAERLARLQSRRPARNESASDGSTGSGSPVMPPTSRNRRRSPAAAAKIITIGGSTTAILGMMAGLGMAERSASNGIPASPVLAPATAVVQVDPTPSTMLSTPTATPTAPTITTPITTSVPVPVPVPVAVELAVPPPPPPQQHQAAPVAQATTSGS